MTEPEIRRALEICHEATIDQPTTEPVIYVPVAKYEAMLRALLKARELLREMQASEMGAWGLGNELDLKVRAFLAEGESA